MTNHPRSPRAKFKKGQVVFHEDDYFVVIAIRKTFLWLVCGSSKQAFRVKPDEIRPLTKLEAGR